MNSDFFAKKNIIKQRPSLCYLKEGADKQPHDHPHPEFIFLIGGSGRFETGQNHYPIKAGDLIICGKGVSHCEYMFDSPENNIVHLGFDKTILGGMKENEIISEPFCIIHTGNKFDLIKTYILAIADELNEPKLSGNIVTENLLCVLLITVLRLAVSDTGFVYAKNKSFFEAKDYFDKNYIAIERIEDACKILGINKYYLTHIFKERLGMPPVKYLLNKRIAKAKTLLTTTNYSIGDIALKCGYTDTGYFCRVFKKNEGITPLQYRIQTKKTLQN